LIIQTLPNDGLLCIRQTTHALLALEFCRHWGNQDFARPAPYSAVMLGISQHDNGWYEWEEYPQLDEEGRPQDFLHAPTAAEKRALWMRSVYRTYAQHPYAGLLVAGHAALLYQDNMATTPEDEQAQTAAFLAELTALPGKVRALWWEDEEYGPALRDERLLANTHLLKFGDNASLQVCVPWGAEGVLHECPVDGEGEYIEITMRVCSGGDPTSSGSIYFDPWPFGVEEFRVGVHGRILTQSRFKDNAAYQEALRRAPMQRLTWQVTPS
jgi:hypothetical protein